MTQLETQFILSSTVLAHGEDLKSLSSTSVAGETLILSGSRDRQVCFLISNIPPKAILWSCIGGREFTRKHTFSSHSHFVNSVLLFGARALTASHDKTINLYDTASGTMIHTLRGHTNNVCGLAALGNMAFSCSWDKTIRVWDLASGSCTSVLSGHQAAVWSVLPLSSQTVLSGIYFLFLIPSFCRSND